MQLKTARLIFTTGALFNWGAVLLFLPALGIARMVGIDPVPTGTIMEDVALLAIFLFGLGYWMVAHSPTEHRGIVKLGLLGKLLVWAIVVAHFLAGSANLAWMLVASVDLIYAALFLLHLRTTRRPRPGLETATEG